MPSPLDLFPGASEHRQRIEDALLSVVASEEELMAEMSSHLIQAGGKRQRPLFAAVCAAAGATGADDALAAVTDDVILGGVAVELVQVGSLCHDDVIDEADTRRGAESVNARWGNLKAILVGDFLLAKSSEIAAGLGTEVAGLLASTIARLCEGEVLELRSAYDPGRREAAYYSAIEGKTAALFATACRVGAIVSGLPRDDVDRLTDFGRHYGMAFQVVDDVLDVVADEATLGKPAAHDIAEGIYNLPVLRALAAGGPDAERLRSMLGSPVGGAELAAARDLVRGSVGIEESVAVASGYIDQAITTLAPLGERPTSTALAGAAAHLLEDLATVRSGA